MSTTAVLSVVGVGLAAYLVGVLLWAMARFFTSRRKPSYATTHRYEELHQLAGAALREAHGDRAQAARIMRHATRLPRRTINTALLLGR